MAFDYWTPSNRGFLASYRQYPLHLPSIHIHGIFCAFPLDALLPGETEVIEDTCSKNSSSKSCPMIFYASSGQKTMSRSVIYTYEGDDSKSMALLSDEASSSVDIWSLPWPRKENVENDTNAQQPRIIQKLPSNCNESILGIARSMIETKEWIAYCTASQAILYSSSGLFCE